MSNKWWQNSITKRVNFLNHNYCNLISSICSKIFWAYPQMPIEISDLYNVVLYKLGQEIIYYSEEIPIEKYISRRSKILAKNQSRKYLTKKYEVLNRAVLFSEHMEKYQKAIQFDEPSKEYEIDSSHLDELEKNIFKYFHVANHNMLETMNHFKITRYTLKEKIKQISKKIVIKNV